MIFPHPKGYVCYRAAHAFPIDGDLSKEIWQNAPWTDVFVDIEGDIRPKPRFQTRAKMLWDDENFYIAAELLEPHVWGTLTEHDSVIFYDNDFEVFIDPDGDNHDYGELELNALNTTWDLRLPKPYRDGGPALNEWELVGMKTAVQVQGTLNDPSDIDTGWTVEIAIPWSALATLSGGHRPVSGQQWRVNFSRVEWDIEIVDGKYQKIPDRPEHNWVWSPQYVVDMHRPELWGYVEFSDQTTGTATITPDPTWETRCQLMAAYWEAREANALTEGWSETQDSLTIQYDSKLIK